MIAVDDMAVEVAKIRICTLSGHHDKGEVKESYGGL